MQSLGWTAYEACGGGVVHLITDIADQKLAKRNIFCVKDGCPFFFVKPLGDGMFACDIIHVEQKELDYIEFLFNSRDENNFLYARNAEITRPLDKAILTRGRYSLSCAGACAAV